MSVNEDFLVDYDFSCEDILKNYYRAKYNIAVRIFDKKKSTKTTCWHLNYSYNQPKL